MILDNGITSAQLLSSYVRHVPEVRVNVTVQLNVLISTVNAGKQML